MEKLSKLSPHEYIEATMYADMTGEYRFFEQYLKPNDEILDIGFGSARDMLHFKSKGYKTYGIDIEEEFVEHAKSLGLSVELADIMKYSPDHRFDAIWACSSLTHTPSDELHSVFDKIKTILKPGGVAYCSFKYGTFEGYIAEKYFTYLTEEKLSKLNLHLLGVQIDKDNLNRGNNWISFVFKNVD